MRITMESYADRVLACWIGKNVGGTLGAPFEWRRQVNEVSFYTQDLGGEPLPNDDLDIQLLWLVMLEDRGLDLNEHVLADAWLTFVTPHWAEYGTAKMNLRAGYPPPLSGSLNNDFKHSCGAYIRAEIWACIAPGLPHLAARYAMMDGMLDHGDGEGTWAEVFMAALESAAFVEPDIPRLIDLALGYLPEDSGVRGAVELAVRCHREGRPLLECRDAILEHFRGSAFFGWEWSVSEPDQRKGFVEGKLGWDVPSNIGLTIAALLYGEGDFGASVCAAVNCGEDTDCTAATVGSIFGILHGTAGIPEKWLAPIGRKIKTACLNLGELGHFGDRLPQTVDEMTERTVRVGRRLLERHHRLTPEGIVLDSGSLEVGSLRAEIERALRGPTYRFGDLTFHVDYFENGPMVHETSSTIRIEVLHRGQVQTHLVAEPFGCQGLELSTSPSLVPVMPPHFARRSVVEVEVRRTAMAYGTRRALILFSRPGWPDVYPVPLVLFDNPGGVAMD